MSRVGEHAVTKQLVAGDGYLASNERVLQFGVGSAVVFSELIIQWPSGETALHLSSRRLRLALCRTEVLTLESSGYETTCVHGVSIFVSLDQFVSPVAEASRLIGGTAFCELASPSETKISQTSTDRVTHRSHCGRNGTIVLESGKSDSA